MTTLTVLSRVASSSQEWLAREEERLRPAPRRTSASVSSPVRLVLLVAVYVTVALLSQGLMGPGGDSALFTSAGRMLLSRHWMDTFANPEVQSGPLFLLLHGIGSRVTAGSGLPPWAGGGALVAVAVALLMSAACRTVFEVYALARPAAAYRELGVGLVFALTGGLTLVTMFAHPDDVLVVLLLVVAAGRSALGRPVSAGALFGLAVGVKLWAIAACVVLLIRASRAAAVRAGLAAALCIALIYGPFFLFGHVNTFHWTWQVEDPAPINLIVATNASYTWWLRLLQGGVAVTVGLLAVRSSRGRAYAVWLVPATVVAGRLLLDPRGLVYYYPPLLLCLLLGQWAGGPLSVLGTSMTSAAWMVGLIGVFVVATHTVGSIWVGAFCVAVIVAGIRRRSPGPTGRT